MGLVGGLNLPHIKVKEIGIINEQTSNEMAGLCCMPPRHVMYKGTYVPYDGTYGTSNQGQTLDM
jgi:hypothetical protein